jgi:serine/threonine-protein kinase
MTDAIARLGGALQDRYRLDRELGQGGMATVYLAEDLKHHRQVAIKVLRPELAAALGAERFLKEIETTANLQHPHILPLFDSGAAGQQLPGGRGGAEGQSFLYYVMPYVAGESLRDRMAREGELPVGESVRIARAVASALGAAHRRGIVHRDIKPENILLADGEPVVADFGIARAITVAGGDRLTSTGLAVGTPAYMSPEQASADSRVDGRTDLYSLGALLYEMLAGEQPFHGRSAEAITARKMTEDPPGLHSVRPAVPEALEHVVRKALARTAADRYQTAEEFIGELDQAFHTHSGSSPILPASRVQAPMERWAPWALAVGLTIVIALLLLRGRADSGPQADLELSVMLPRNTELYGMNNAFELSPDGSTLVFTAGRNDSTRLYARRLDDFTMRQLPGTEGGDAPFFSPDGRWVGFFARRERQMKKVLLAGGTPIVIAEDLESGAGYGQWGRNDTIYFANWPDIQIRKVAASGGAIGTVTHGAPPDGWWRLPLALFPDGRHALVEVIAMVGGHLDVVSLETGEHHLVLKDVVDARLMADGTLLYVPPRHTDILAVPFDLATMKVTAEPVTALDSVAVYPDGSIGYFSVSPGGTLAYVPLTEWIEWPTSLDLVLVDRNGTPQQGHLPAGAGPRFSPDGGRLIYQRLDQRDRVAEFVYDLAHRTEARLTPYEQKWSYDGWPIFSADGRRVVFNSDRSGSEFLLLYSTPADGSGHPTRLATDTVMHQQPFTWTGDGRELIYTEGPGPNGMDIWTVPVDGGGAARPLMQGPSNETQPALSPDGKWLAWVTDASGRLEVMIRRYPDGPDVQVSRGGGAEPVWGPGGRELYFRDLAGTQVLIAPFHPGDPPVVDSARVLITGRYGRCMAWCRNFDISPDGSRFVMQKAWDRVTLTGYWPMGTEIRIVPHWDRILRQKLEAARRER